MWSDTKRHEKVPRRVGVNRSMSDKVDERVLSWFGHMERSKSDGGLKQARGFEIDGTVGRG